MKIYVENLDSVIDNEKLKQVFSAYGEVTYAEVIKDLFTNVSRGFGYVEMEEIPAQNAIRALNQTVLNDLTITVKEAVPEPERSEGTVPGGCPRRRSGDRRLVRPAGRGGRGVGNRDGAGRDGVL